MVAHIRGPLLPKLRGQFAEFLQHRSLKRLGILYLSTCVGLGYGHTAGLFPGTPSLHPQSNKQIQLTAFVTSARPWNINQVPIDYAFRPRLRDRLTLRGLALRRNPWTFGERVSHPLYRYSCQHSHFRYLQHASRHTFTGLRNAPLPSRGQMTGIRDQNEPSSAVPTCHASPGASWRSRDTRFANASRSLHLYIPGQSNSGPIPASRPPSRSRSSESA